MKQPETHTNLCTINKIRRSRFRRDSTVHYKLQVLLRAMTDHHLTLRTSRITRKDSNRRNHYLFNNRPETNPSTNNNLTLLNLCQLCKRCHFQCHHTTDQQHPLLPHSRGFNLSHNVLKSVQCPEAFSLNRALTGITMLKSSKMPSSNSLHMRRNSPLQHGSQVPKRRWVAKPSLQQTSCSNRSKNKRKRS